jgi:hypothetical protein
MSERREVEVTINVQHEGYAAAITASCTVDQIPGLIRRLKEQGIEPAGTQSGALFSTSQNSSISPQVTQAIANGPMVCPVHQRPLKASKHKPGEWYCPVRLGTDPVTGANLYCEHKVYV